MNTHDAVGSVAVIRFSSLGDVVLAIPVFQHLKHTCPQCRLTVITKQKFGELLQNDPAIDTLALLDDTGQHRGWWGLVRFARTLGPKRYDWVIDLHGSVRSYLLTFLITKKRIVRYDKERALRKKIIKTKDRTLVSLPTVEKYFKAFGPLGIPRPEAWVPKLYAGDRDKQWALSVLPKAKDRDIIGINIGSRWPEKRWPAGYFRALIQDLAQRYLVILLGDAGDEGFAQGIGLKTGVENVIDMTGKTRLGQLLALIGRCRVLVTGDSGPMHVAAGLNIPVVALFGPTHPALGFSPLGGGNRVITRGIECSPCSLHGEKPCIHDRVYCMERITVKEVEQAVEGLLAGEHS